MPSFVSLLTMRKKLSALERDIQNIQLDMFAVIKQGSIFESPEKSPSIYCITCFLQILRISRMTVY